VSGYRHAYELYGWGRNYFGNARSTALSTAPDARVRSGGVCESPLISLRGPMVYDWSTNIEGAVAPSRCMVVRARGWLVAMVVTGVGELQDMTVVILQAREYLPRPHVYMHPIVCMYTCTDIDIQ
jgi:hypothetical protein